MVEKHSIRSSHHSCSSWCRSRHYQQAMHSFKQSMFVLLNQLAIASLSYRQWPCPIIQASYNRVLHTEAGHPVIEGIQLV